MRYLIREAQTKDLFDLLNLSRAFPLYNLPSNEKILEKKIDVSQKSFQKNLNPEDRNYLFVLEDRKLKKVVGSSQILSFSGQNHSHCYLWEKQSAPGLKLIQVKTKRQQLGGLILDKKYRSSPEQLALQIGGGRFLYVKLQIQSFSPFFEVSLTGPFQKKDNPFWSETGARHLKQDYLQALEMYRDNYSLFIKNFPKTFKTPLSSLSSSAQFCLSHTHPQTLPAYKALIKRAFHYKRRHHILDGAIYLESMNPVFLKNTQAFLLKFEKQVQGSSFLIGQNSSKGFVCAKVKAQKRGRILKTNKNPVFEENKKIMAFAIS